MNPFGHKHGARRAEALAQPAAEEFAGRAAHDSDAGSSRSRCSMAEGRCLPGTAPPARRGAVMGGSAMHAATSTSRAAIAHNALRQGTQSTPGVTELPAAPPCRCHRRSWRCPAGPARAGRRRASRRQKPTGAGCWISCPTPLARRTGRRLPHMPGAASRSAASSVSSASVARRPTVEPADRPRAAGRPSCLRTPRAGQAHRSSERNRCYIGSGTWIRSVIRHAVHAQHSTQARSSASTLFAYVRSNPRRGSQWC